jgi:hypothetical protein
MSDTFLKLVPLDPNFVPGSREQAEAVALLSTAFPDGEDVEAEVYDTVTFIDNGENTEAIICTVCGRSLEFADELAAEVMGQVNDAIDAGSISTQTITMPCCGSIVAVTSLRFDWPAGFARFELSIRNPNVDRPIPDEVRQRLEVALGSPLLEIWAHI